ncbi:MAG: MarR family transcriptional regulator [Verrucomicrobiota bacterium]|nr:MarR family transcriptional regulator [Verrucomicrobiota bacterium]
MSPPDNSDEPRKEGIAATDEILQVMYWLRGEKIAQDVAPAELARWVALDAEAIAPLLEKLVVSGLLDYAPGTEMRYRLTSAGGSEGGRRFADEFADMIKPGHYECSDPNCDCRQTGNPADCVHQH